MQSDSLEDVLDDRKTLRVNNLGDHATQESVTALFHKFGPLQRVYVAKKKHTFRSRGFAFVSFQTHDDAQAALNTWQGQHNLRLSWAKPESKDERLQMHQNLASG